MKNLLLLFCGIVLLLFIIFPTITLSKIDNRNCSYTLPEEIKYRINEETANFDDYNPEELLCSDMCKISLDYSLNLTAELLEFSKTNDIEKGKANCIGYAQVCAAIYNYICQKHSIDSYAKPVVGSVLINNFNLCHLVVKLFPKYKNFLKDHDFIEVKMNGYSAYYDPSAYDVLGNSFRTIK